MKIDMNKYVYMEVIQIYPGNYSTVMALVGPEILESLNIDTLEHLHSYVVVLNEPNSKVRAKVYSKSDFYARFEMTYDKQPTSRPRQIHYREV